jgi:hypothetical protein
MELGLGPEIAMFGRDTASRSPEDVMRPDHSPGSD